MAVHLAIPGVSLSPGTTSQIRQLPPLGGAEVLLTWHPTPRSSCCTSLTPAKAFLSTYYVPVLGTVVTKTQSFRSEGRGSRQALTPAMRPRRAQRTGELVCRKQGGGDS